MQLWQFEFILRYILAINSYSLFNLFFGDDFFPSIFTKFKRIFKHTLLEMNKILKICVAN